MGLVRGSEICGWGPWDQRWTWCLLHSLCGRLCEFLLTDWIVGLLGGIEETVMFQTGLDHSQFISEVSFLPYHGQKVRFK